MRLFVVFLWGIPYTDGQRAIADHWRGLVPGPGGLLGGLLGLGARWGNGVGWGGRG